MIALFPGLLSDAFRIIAGSPIRPIGYGPTLIDSVSVTLPNSPGPGPDLEGPTVGRSQSDPMAAGSDSDSSELGSEPEPPA